MFNRRQMLIVGAASMALAGSPLKDILGQDDRPVYGGWLPRADARDLFIRRNRRPYLRQYWSAIKGTGQDKQVLLWKPYEAVTKQTFTPAFQEIGDCCGQAGTLGAQFLCATQIAMHKANEEWRGPFSVEFTYAGSRVEIGEGKLKKKEDGSTGAWTAEFLRQYGVLLRGKYGNIDLTKYRPDLGTLWGDPKVGVPDELELVAKKHPIRTVALVESWEQACDCIANGYPVMVCSSVGFHNVADRDGFLNRFNGRKLVRWYHAMLLVGIDTKSSRQGGCFAQSWGTNWLNGPTHKLGAPAGGFWADARNIDAALKEGDSYALSNFAGFPRQALDYYLY